MLNLDTFQTSCHSTAITSLESLFNESDTASLKYYMTVMGFASQEVWSVGYCRVWVMERKFPPTKLVDRYVMGYEGVWVKRETTVPIFP